MPKGECPRPNVLKLGKFVTCGNTGPVNVLYDNVSATASKSETRRGCERGWEIGKERKLPSFPLHLLSLVILANVDGSLPVK